jgi:glycerophosphoryl diester phosphodiesterase
LNVPRLNRRAVLSGLLGVSALNAAGCGAWAQSAPQASPCRFDCIAHRGFSRQAPENTLAAFKKAVDLGARDLDLDMQISADGVPVVIHDRDVGRVSGGLANGEVILQTLDDLRRVDVGSSFSPHYRGEQIPTLQEVCDFAKQHGCTLHAEVKRYRKIGDIDIMLDTIAQSQMSDRIVLYSFRTGDLRYLRRRSRELTIAKLAKDAADLDVVASMLPKARFAIGISGVRRDWSVLDTIRSKGLDICVWTVDDLPTIRRLVASGAQSIVSNHLVAQRDVC